MSSITSGQACLEIHFPLPGSSLYQGGYHLEAGGGKVGVFPISEGAYFLLVYRVTTFLSSTGSLQPSDFGRLPSMDG